MSNSITGVRDAHANVFYNMFRNLAIAYYHGERWAGFCAIVLPSTLCFSAIMGVMVVVASDLGVVYSVLLTIFGICVYIVCAKFALGYLGERGLYYVCLDSASAGECYHYVKNYRKHYDTMLDVALSKPDEVWELFPHTVFYWYMEFPSDRDKIFSFIMDGLPNSFEGNTFRSISGSGISYASFIGAGLCTLSYNTAPDGFADDFPKHCASMVRIFYGEALRYGGNVGSLIGDFIKRVNDGYYNEWYRMVRPITTLYDDLDGPYSLMRMRTDCRFFTYDDFYSYLPADAQLGVMI